MGRTITLRSDTALRHYPKHDDNRNLRAIPIEIHNDQERLHGVEWTARQRWIWGIFPLRSEPESASSGVVAVARRDTERSPCRSHMSKSCVRQSAASESRYLQRERARKQHFGFCYQSSERNVQKRSSVRQNISNKNGCCSILLSVSFRENETTSRKSSRSVGGTF